ncbi:sugar transferase [Arthrobacter sp. HLT1-20]
MTSPRIHAPFGKRLVSGTASGPFTSRSKGPKHAVWDALPVDRSGTAGGAHESWSGSYRWKLRITDSITITAVIAISYLVWFGMGVANSGRAGEQGNYLVSGLLLLLLWTLDLEFCRTRETGVVGIGATEYKRVLHSTLRVFGALAIMMVALNVEIVRGFFALAFPLGALLLLSTRWGWRRWLARERQAGRCLSDVVILGAADDVGYVIAQLKNNLSAGYKVVGVALTSLTEGTELRPPWHKIPVMSTMADIGRVIAITGAQTVIVAGPLPGGPSAIRELGWRLEDMSTELVLASNLTNVAGPRIHFRPVEGLPLMHVELPQYSGGRHMVKRAMDVAVSACTLILILPLLLVLALIVRLDSKGPVLFFQDRVGRNGEPFKMAKFRSMVTDAEAQLSELATQNQGAGVLFKMPNDPRVTSCGRWMRKYSLDELPQFWNVLMGDMSLVGPRPPLKSEVENYEKPTHRRLLIKPGITGLWQVSGRSNLVWDEAVRLDLYYVENWSLTGDFIILWRTFKAVVKPSGAY